MGFISQSHVICTYKWKLGPCPAPFSRYLGSPSHSTSPCWMTDPIFWIQMDYPFSAETSCLKRQDVQCPRRFQNRCLLGQGVTISVTVYEVIYVIFHGSYTQGLFQHRNLLLPLYPFTELLEYRRIPLWTVATFRPTQDKELNQKPWILTVFTVTLAKPTKPGCRWNFFGLCLAQHGVRRPQKLGGFWEDTRDPVKYNRT